MKRNGKSLTATRTTVLETTVFGPLERAAAEGTDPLTLLETEDALRSIGCAKPLSDAIAKLRD